MKNTKRTAENIGIENDKPTAKKTTREKSLHSNGGRTYRGTRQEVRDAALFPVRRDMLARSLSLKRYLRSHGALTQDGYREICAECRRDAIMQGANAGGRGTLVSIPSGLFVLLMAGARLSGKSEKDYFSDLWRKEIIALLDLSETETGKREIPLTRYERAALTASGFDYAGIANADNETRTRRTVAPRAAEVHALEGGRVARRKRTA